MDLQATNIISAVSKDYRRATRWSLRRPLSGGLFRLKKKIRKFFISLSGNDVGAMLAFVLKNEEKRKVCHKYVEALEGISFFANNEKFIKVKYRQSLSHINLPSF
jgi:hypothetical protein